VYQRIIVWFALLAETRILHSVWDIGYERAADAFEQASARDNIIIFAA
jgi:hypothetical protein